MLTAISLGTLVAWISAGLAIGGAFMFINKLFQWFKDIREKDLASIKKDVTDVKSTLDVKLDKLEAAVTSQTDKLVAELKEMRQDFRTFYHPPSSSATITGVPSVAPTLARAKKATKPRVKARAKA